MKYGPITLTSDLAGGAVFLSNETLEGHLQNIYIEYGAGCPAPTTVTIDGLVDVTPAAAPLAINYLTVVGNVNNMFFPRENCVDATNVLIYYDLGVTPPYVINQGEVRDCFYMSNPLRITIANLGAPGLTVTVTLFYSDFR